MLESFQPRHIDVVSANILTAKTVPHHRSDINDHSNTTRLSTLV